MVLLALLAWKRPRLAARLGIGWVATLAVSALIAAPCRIYLRAQDAPVLWDVGPAYDALAMLVSLLVLAGLAVLALERSDRRRERCAQCRKPVILTDRVGVGVGNQPWHVACRLDRRKAA